MDAECQDCGHNWQLSKPPSEFEDAPRCGNCNSRDVSVEDDFSDILGGDGTRRDRLEDALRAAPGVGDRKRNWVLKWWDGFESIRTPSKLRERLTKIDGLDADDAQLIVAETFEDAETGGGSPDADQSSARGGGGQPRPRAPPQNSGTDPIQAIAALAEAGVIGQSQGGGGTDTQDIVDALGEVMNESMSQVATTQKQLAAAIQQDAGSGEVEDLKREIRELKEAEKDDRISRLESKLEDLRTGGDEDPQTVQIKESAEIQRKSLDVAQQTLQQMPEKVSETMENAILPLLHRYAPPEEAVHEQIWNPPEEHRGRPSADPTTPADAAGYPPAEDADPAGAATADGGSGPESKDGYAEEVAQRVLDDGDATGGEA